MSGRIVHLGVGAFHRAHQAWYVHEANRRTGSAWRIGGVSLRSPAVRDALRRDGYRYALEIADAEGRRVEVIDAIETVAVAPEDPGAVRALLAGPETALVTITVTEKGYHLRPDGTLDRRAVAGDIEALRNGGAPRTMPGVLLDGLRGRDGPGLTVMSCDNLSANGATLRAALLALAEAAGIPPEVVTRHGFPASMVDRITPAADDSLRARIEAVGAPVRAPVATEAFTEWVVEDAFAGSMPDFAAAGVRIVDDVTPFELRKLRMLNGAHSTLAYAGLNTGYTFVHEAIANPDLRALARAVMKEAAATLPPAVQDDAPAYADALLRRFENPHLAHRLLQIAMDGSRKLPIRLLGTIKDRDDDAPACLRGLKEWTCWLDATFARGAMPDDPEADRLRAGRGRGEDGRTLLENVGKHLERLHLRTASPPGTLA